MDIDANVLESTVSTDVKLVNNGLPLKAHAASVLNEASDESISSLPLLSRMGTKHDQKLQEETTWFIGDEEVYIVEDTGEQNNATVVVQKLKTETLALVQAQALRNKPANPKLEVYGWGQDQMLTKAEGNFAGNPDMIVEPSFLFRNDVLDFNQMQVGRYHAGFWRHGESIVHMLGNASNGQCGFENLDSLDSPTPLKDLDSDIVSVVCGESHTVVVFAYGGLLPFGNNDAGQCAHDPEKYSQLVNPEVILPKEEFSSVACGSEFTLALARSGKVYAWGDGSKGQLGDGKKNSYWKPQVVESLAGQPIVKVTAGDHHCLAYTSTRKLYAWGDNRYGQCGVKSPDRYVTKPKEVVQLRGHRICQICCGGQHTMVLTDVGNVFVWGRNNKNQCKSGTVDKIESPVVLNHDWIEKVIHIACGSNHSVASSKSHIWAWGNNSNGQCTGVISNSNVKRPTMVKWNKKGKLKYLVGVSASNFATFAVISDIEIGAQYTWGLDYLTTRMLQFHEKKSRKTNNWRSFKKLLTSAFSSVSCLNGSFLSDQQVCRPPTFSGMDFNEITKAYNLILNTQPQLVTKLFKLLQSFLRETQIEAAKGKFQDPTLLRFVFVILCNPDIANPGFSQQILQFLNSCLILPGGEVRQELLYWISTFEMGFFRRIINMYQERCIQCAIEARQKIDSDYVCYCIMALDMFHSANLLRKDPVPHELFYSRSITRSKMIDWKKDYQRWLYNGNKDQFRNGSFLYDNFSFCRYSWLLDPVAKNEVLKVEAISQMNQKIRQARLGFGFHMESQFFVLRIARKHILQHTLNIIQRVTTQSLEEFKKPLKVQFEGEEGVDEGGVRKEFFQIMVEQLFNPDFSIFVYDEGTRTYWFNRNSLETPLECRLIGILLGLAIYNGVILDLQFPKVVYKKLCRMPLVLEDLASVDPDIYNSVRRLLDFEGDVSEWGLDFTVSNNFLGEIRQDLLKPNGDRIPVTNDNREEYARLFKEYHLERSINKQFQAFSSGFHDVVGGPALSLFRPEELERLICGNPNLDFDSLQVGALYEGGFDPDHDVIIWLWEILEEFDMDQKKKFLSFSTGSNRAPIKGLHELHLKIQRVGPKHYEGPHLPTSHTCYNTLLLPWYSSKDHLRDRLLVAIENAQGFGLK